MNSPSTTRITTAIISTSGNHYLIDDQENQELLRVSVGGRLVLKSGAIIKESLIGEIMSIDEYYQKYPEKLPASQNYSGFETIEGVIRSYAPPKRDRALRCMINGFKKSFTGKIMSLKATQMLEKMEARLAR